MWYNIRWIPTPYFSEHSIDLYCFERGPTCPVTFDTTHAHGRIHTHTETVCQRDCVWQSKSLFTAVVCGGCSSSSSFHNIYYIRIYGRTEVLFEGTTARTQDKSKASHYRSCAFEIDFHTGAAVQCSRVIIIRYRKGFHSIIRRESRKTFEMEPTPEYVFALADTK